MNVEIIARNSLRIAIIEIIEMIGDNNGYSRVVNVVDCIKQ